MPILQGSHREQTYIASLDDFIAADHLYGYMNRIRSSRRLARECERNMEVRWLLSCLTPCYKTIADFRKDNPCWSKFRTLIVRRITSAFYHCKP